MSLARPWRLLGSLSSTLAVLCTQQRCCSTAVPNSSWRAIQNPSDPSPVASLGGWGRPCALSSRKRSPQESLLSRNPSTTAKSSLVPSSVAPMSTSTQVRSRVEPHVEVGAVGPPVNVAFGAQVPVTPSLVLVFPARLQSN